MSISWRRLSTIRVTLSHSIWNHCLLILRKSIRSVSQVEEKEDINQNSFHSVRSCPERQTVLYSSDAVNATTLMVSSGVWVRLHQTPITQQGRPLSVRSQRTDVLRGPVARLECRACHHFLVAAHFRQCEYSATITNQFLKDFEAVIVNIPLVGSRKSWYVWGYNLWQKRPMRPESSKVFSGLKYTKLTEMFWSNPFMFLHNKPTAETETAD